MCGVGLLANERTNQKCCEYFSTKALKCGTRSSVANPSSPLPQNSPLTSYLVLPLQPNGMSCTCASMPTNYHAYTRASCTPSYILPHTYAATVCSGMCELWARSSFQAHPGTPPVGGGATRDRYPSVHACLTRFETLPNYITTTRGKSRQKGYPKSLSLSPSFPLLPSLSISVSNGCAETLDLLRAFISSLEILIIVSPTSSLASIFSQFSIIDGKEDVLRNIPLIFFHGMILQNFESITNVPLSNRIWIFSTLTYPFNRLSSHFTSSLHTRLASTSIHH